MAHDLSPERIGSKRDSGGRYSLRLRQTKSHLVIVEAPGYFIVQDADIFRMNPHLVGPPIPELPDETEHSMTQTALVDEMDYFVETKKTREGHISKPATSSKTMKEIIKLWEVRHLVSKREDYGIRLFTQPGTEVDNAWQPRYPLLTPRDIEEKLRELRAIEQQISIRTAQPEVPSNTQVEFNHASSLETPALPAPHAHSSAISSGPEDDRTPPDRAVVPKSIGNEVANSTGVAHSSNPTATERLLTLFQEEQGQDRSWKRRNSSEIYTLDSRSRKRGNRGNASGYGRHSRAFRTASPSTRGSISESNSPNKASNNMQVDSNTRVQPDQSYETASQVPKEEYQSQWKDIRDKANSLFTDMIEDTKVSQSWIKSLEDEKKHLDSQIRDLKSTIDQLNRNAARYESQSEAQRSQFQSLEKQNYQYQKTLAQIRTVLENPTATTLRSPSGDHEDDLAHHNANSNTMIPTDTSNSTSSSTSTSANQNPSTMRTTHAHAQAQNEDSAGADLVKKVKKMVRDNIKMKANEGQVKQAMDFFQNSFLGGTRGEGNHIPYAGDGEI